jgi:hypothetical protein
MQSGLANRYIEEWKEFAPWPENSQVEQDLVIERALIEIFSDPFLNENLAFPQAGASVSLVPTKKIN